MSLPNIFIVGFGRFGRYLRDQIIRGCPGIEIDVADKEFAAAKAECAALVVFCVPIRDFESTFAAYVPHFKTGATVMDTCSVKSHPGNIMNRCARQDINLVGVHPLFGPQSAPLSCAGQRTAICPVRGDHSGAIELWEKTLGTTPIVCTCEAHDRQMSTQLLNHFIGRSGQAAGLKRVELSTKTHELFMDIQDIVCGNSAELFYDMNRFNPCAREARDSFLAAAKGIHEYLISYEANKPTT